MQAAPRAVRPLVWGPNGSGVVLVHGAEGRHGPNPTSQSGNIRQFRQEDSRAGASSDKPPSDAKRSKNGYNHGSSSLSFRDVQAASQTDIKPPIKQSLERREVNPGGGVKRPASAQGREEKRQRTEAPRVPGWKAKAAEAVDVTDQFALEDVNKDAFKKKVERETDAHRLAQRQKQIDFGKNTLGYERYLEVTPKAKRQKGDPTTPRIHQVCSKRSWDGQIKKWRRFLHRYDPPVDDEAEFAEEEYVPGYRDNAGGVKEDETGAEGAPEESAEEEEAEEVKASIFEDDEDEFVGL
ncbi:hypothetical protein KFL_000340100 [Klebsormidium nitens]|uniref:Histone RNA hairpin-binding protein RNA-binding domain-containing protein n=1 Tax=Klebsormidium nitens TaxID=105231 RepID=A0A1Y1HST1_KLENI|nr:hypothetical protein KFL_000340100 [Klebsormidium nitens]|eukprot:GAQ79607.1 hypothetical protein KFL_000340100 [Klebsormidium nitens]